MPPTVLELKISNFRKVHRSVTVRIPPSYVRLYLGLSQSYGPEYQIVTRVLDLAWSEYQFQMGSTLRIKQGRILFVIVACFILKKEKGSKGIMSK